MRIIIDAMGGDNAPNALVQGAIEAVNMQEGFDIILVGDEKIISSVMASEKILNPKRISIVHAEEIITSEDIPTRAIKTKKKSSMVLAFNLLKNKQAEAFISAGNSGALLTGALLILGRLPGVDRPALGAVVPTKRSKCLIIDAGLNSTCKPINYIQFAMFGTIYMKSLLNIENPIVGLVNMGTEDNKGSEVLKQAYKVLSESDFNFVGNIEGKDVPLGCVDVAVCDGYVGNVMLKFLEGTGAYFSSFLKTMFKRTIFSKLALLFVMKDIKNFKKLMDPSEDGGAPVLGVNGVVMKSHGNSDSKTIRNVIIKTCTLVDRKVIEQIKDNMYSVEVKHVSKKEPKRWRYRDRKLHTRKDTK